MFFLIFEFSLSAHILKIRRFHIKIRIPFFSFKDAEISKYLANVGRREDAPSVARPLSPGLRGHCHLASSLRDSHVKWSYGVPQLNREVQGLRRSRTFHGRPAFLPVLLAGPPGVWGHFQATSKHSALCFRPDPRARLGVAWRDLSLHWGMPGSFPLGSQGLRKP